MTQLNSEPYIWQKPEWPYFQWDSSALLESLVKVRHFQGRLISLNQIQSKAFQKNLNLTPIQIDILENYLDFLTKDRLFGWHASLFPNGYSGIRKIMTADFRKKDVLFASQDLPLAKTLNEEIKKFLSWWNDSPVGLDGIIRAGIAYFWFLTLRPLEDGNEQLAISLINLALAQDEKIGLRPYSVQNIFIHNK